MNTTASHTLHRSEASSAHRELDRGALAVDTPAVEIVIPVYNEERALAASVRKLHRYMKREFTFAFQLTIADNASVDETLAVARGLAAELAEVELLHLEDKGRGRALRAAWMRSRADVVAYMDVDLSTELSALPSLLVPLLQRRADVAIGSRLAPGAEVTRGIKRELISRSYNILLRATLGVGFSDAQCGFKAVRRELIASLLERVEDEQWFFDTELLYQAERARLSIHEVPVRWVDDADSRVEIVATAREDLRGIRRLRRAARAARAGWRSADTTDAPVQARRSIATGAAPFDLVHRRA
ncbi:MAG TPA: dolichyl-phosphate beta-glucosyltransferase [Solirubrobacteraceae bacterium]|jgi:glycosyltransferase involved in cell wall biosynthesis|nr:dolichyl-phosphate beta-glucosyltransferase [Solirubrobacteraceae bacterium]